MDDVETTMRRFGPLLALCCWVPALACAPLESPSDAGSSDDAGETTVDAGDAISTADAGDPEVLVGRFQLRLLEVPANEGGNTLAASLVGKVYDGPTPQTLVWETQVTDGDCVLKTPRVPFCATSCGSSAACVEDDTCAAYPVAKPVGAVTVTGVKSVSGASAFVMTPIANAYQPPGSVELALPPFDEGSDLVLSAAGSATTYAFSLENKGISALELTSDTPVLDGTDLTLAWTPPADTTAARVTVKLDISHHGGTKGELDCDTADDGTLVIPGSLVQSLLDLGVAGYPTIVITRARTTSAVIPAGRVDFLVASEVERAVTVPGLVSCTSDTDCDDGLTCANDLTCR